MEGGAGAAGGRWGVPPRHSAEGSANVRAAVGWEKEDDAAATARPAHFSGPRAGVGRRFDRGINLRRRDSRDQRFAMLPLLRERFAGRTKIGIGERLLHLGRALRDALESLVDFSLAIDLALVHFPVVRS